MPQPEGHKRHTVCLAWRGYDPDGGIAQDITKAYLGSDKRQTACTAQQSTRQSPTNGSTNLTTHHGRQLSHCLPLYCQITKGKKGQQHHHREWQLIRNCMQLLLHLLHP